MVFFAFFELVDASLDVVNGLVRLGLKHILKTSHALNEKAERIRPVYLFENLEQYLEISIFLLIFSQFIQIVVRLGDVSDEKGRLVVVVEAFQQHLLILFVGL